MKCHNQWAKIIYSFQPFNTCFKLSKITQNGIQSSNLVNTNVDLVVSQSHLLPEPEHQRPAQNVENAE